MNLKTVSILLSAFLMISTAITGEPGSYDDYETPKSCGASCHTAFYQQWRQMMMSQCYTHHWDEIEYFELAVRHAERDKNFTEVRDACDGCHTPVAYHAGDNPPPRPALGSRANESVSCDFCHTVTGFTGDTPYNFNHIKSPGRVKFGPRKNIDSPNHQARYSEFLSKPEFCGTCHNEMSPFGVWVKSTHLEWKAGPYAVEGVRCQDCHMTTAPGITASMGKRYDDVRLHLFHGAHDPGKIAGTIELRIEPDIREVVPGETAVFYLYLFNQKTGHKFPTGSVEDRIVWCNVEAVDAEGNVHHLPVDKKGFEGEEYTIAAEILAYQDMGVPLDLPNFKGVQRDGVPAGDRIFRMPYFDPEGRMTIMQWNTKSLGIDYRIGPRETIKETYTFNLPDNLALGEMKVTARIYYSKLVKPVADFLKVPAEESEPVLVNEHSTTVNVID